MAAQRLPEIQSAPVAPPTPINEEEFRKGLKYYDDSGRTDHIAIWNDVPIRSAAVVKAVFDGNGWLPEALVRLNGGNKEAVKGTYDIAGQFIRFCNDIQQGMRAVWLVPAVKNWLNSGIDWCCSQVWCVAFPDARKGEEERARALAAVEPFYKEWAESFAIPWWQKKRKNYDSLEEMAKKKVPMELAGESIDWIKKNLTAKLPQNVAPEDVAASFVNKFQYVAEDFESSWLEHVGRIARDVPTAPSDFNYDVRRITSIQIRDRTR